MITNTRIRFFPHFAIILTESLRRLYRFGTVPANRRRTTQQSFRICQSAHDSKKSFSIIRRGDRDSVERKTLPEISLFSFPSLPNVDATLINMEYCALFRIPYEALMSRDERFAHFVNRIFYSRDSNRCLPIREIPSCYVSLANTRQT